MGADRVLTLDLDDESLTGTLSRRLGDLTGLTTLKLADNSLTGHIPASLADLDLDELKLSGNSFVGCIPAGCGTSRTTTSGPWAWGLPDAAAGRRQ